MYTVHLYPEPASDWEERCSTQSLFLFQAGWRKCLEKISYHNRFFYGAINGVPCLLVSAFRKLFFDVVYLNFPIGIDDDLLRSVIVDDIFSIANADLLRIVVSRCKIRDLPYARITDQPRVLITDLKTWSADELGSSIKRNLKRAQKLELRSSDPADVEAITTIYEQTIGRHGGARRYNIEYFEEFIRASGSCGEATALSCFHDDVLCGYMMSAKHGKTTYYLHGGYSYELQNLRPMDLLMKETITIAKQNNCDEFDFLASPPDQAGLLKFKMKWGGIETIERTLDIPSKSLGGRLYNSLAR
jgi:hypothetical protein